MSRGKIMRDTNAGPGIVFVDGAQKSFTLEAHWKSSSPPKVGAVVEVTVDSAGNPLSVEPIDETALAKEQAKKALNFALFPSTSSGTWSFHFLTLYKLFA